jgi:hypothetical protein
VSLQDAIDSSITGAGANRVGDRIELGKEVIDLHQTLDIASSEGGAAGVRVEGRGRATKFRWLGPESGPVFRFSDGSGCELAGITIEFVNPAGVVVQMLDSGSGPVRSSRNTLRDIHVPDASGKTQTFWWIGGGADQKNDLMRGYDLDVSGCEIGLLVEGRNSLNHELYGCLFKGRSSGKTGIRTANGGSVRMFGGALVQFAESVFDIDTRNGVALIASGVHVEKCARLLVAPEPETPAITTHITILDGVRWGVTPQRFPTTARSSTTRAERSSFAVAGSGREHPAKPPTGFATPPPKPPATSSSRIAASARPIRRGTGRGCPRTRCEGRCSTSVRRGSLRRYPWRSGPLPPRVKTDRCKARALDTPTPGGAR